MAISAHAFSPKEFTCWIKNEATCGTSVLASSGMYQLDVDSVSYPSLNVTQALDVRSGTGRTFKDEDFFQDNIMRVAELSLSGTLHADVGHKMLLQNITNNTQSENGIVAAGHFGTNQLYATGATNNASCLTVVIRSSDHTNQRSLEFAGCVVTNFAISADLGTEGGRYKWTATLQSGKKPDLNESSTAAGGTAYVNTDHPILSGASGIRLMGGEVTMNSFTCAIDHPAVFTGITSTGYEAIARGSEIAVTVDTQVKYDSVTKSFVHDFDNQSAANTSDTFVIINNGKFGVNIDNGVYTNVAYSEGDIMMLDCSVKSVDNGTNPLVTVDVTD